MQEGAVPDTTVACDESPHLHHINIENGTTKRRLLWKVDMLLMPIMTFSYGLQYVSNAPISKQSAYNVPYQYDKFVFSSAAASGMLADLHLTTPVPGTKLFSTHRYSTA
jgi:hypothetical protein